MLAVAGCGGEGALTSVPVLVLVVMEAGSLFTVSSHNTHTVARNYTGEIN